MSIDPGILLAALGITMLELAEAAAVGLALFAESGRYAAFLYVAAGTAVVFLPTFLVGDLVSYLPLLFVRLVGAVLLLYFGQRLARSARRSVVRSRTTGFPTEAFEKGLMYTGFSVGAVEAFEASIVLVGLIPENFGSATVGFVAGVAVVAVATFVLRSQVRKIKQANMKVVVSGLLLTFSAFWFAEALVAVNDLLLIPLFAVFAVAVHQFANRPTPPIAPGAEAPTAAPEAHK
ncbi:MAG: hypothetical protein JRN21_05780 [Nitrososphaerota archaeon]|nr:hypothetical protein [Nitrososphaerota archaeon]